MVVMKRLIFILMISVILPGCEKRAGDEIYRRSFAMVFYETGSMELMTNPDNKTILNFIISLNNSIGSYKDTGSRKTVYDALCQKHGDMTYNREEFVPFGREPSFLAYNPISVDIVSDANFDEEHLAGTSLADLIIFSSFSSKPFINSGYVEHDWGENEIWYSHMAGKQPYYPVHKKVSDLTIEDLTLLYGFGSTINGALYFQSLPTLSKVHNITVTFTDERGETFSDTIEMNFE